MRKDRSDSHGNWPTSATRRLKKLGLRACSWPIMALRAPQNPVQQQRFVIRIAMQPLLDRARIPELVELRLGRLRRSPPGVRRPGGGTGTRFAK